MTKRKLLMYFSYLGTNFRGLQLLSARRTREDLKTIIPEYDTVQGVLEQALRKVLQHRKVVTYTSSRTDTGVHAYSSTFHFEVDDEAFVNIPFSPEVICQSLNLYLEKNQTDIRVQRVVEVPADFYARRAHSRTYNYRIALAKDNDFHNCYSLLKLTAFSPITQIYQAHVVPQPFDVQAVQQGCRVFIGKWNFRSFASLTSKTLKGNPNRPDLRAATEEDFIKTIHRFSFSKSNIAEDPELVGYYSHDPSFNKIDFYDFHVEGSGFLRRQVRRMVGVLLSIGRGTLSSSDILRLLENPSEKNWPSQASTTASHGLFLKSVNYKNLPVLRGYLSN